MTEWFSETLHSGWGQRFQVVKWLARERSDFQEIAVFESASHGRVLVLDGCVQITEADEFVYQEMITHVPLVAHTLPQRVLIIGAGDGGVLRHCLQHGTVEDVTMVEIDGAVVRLAREFLPAISGHAWADPRAKLIIGDGVEFVRNTPPGTFNVIIVDSTDPAGVGEALFTERFYADCARALGDGGIIVSQSGVPFMQADELQTTSAWRASAFTHVTAFVAAVPTYVGGLMTLGFATNAPGAERVPEPTLTQRAARAGILGHTRYWSPGVHAAAFHLPPYIARLLPTRAAA